MKTVQTLLHFKKSKEYQHKHVKHKHWFCDSWCPMQGFKSCIWWVPIASNDCSDLRKTSDMGLSLYLSVLFYNIHFIQVFLQQRGAIEK